MKLEISILGRHRIDQKRRRDGRLGEMKKGRRERIEKGSRERIEKERKEKKTKGRELRRQFEEEDEEYHHLPLLVVELP